MSRAFDDEDNDDNPGVRFIFAQPPLKQGKVFVDYDERATISQSLEEAFVALDYAFRGIWNKKALEFGEVCEYWDDEDIDELRALTLKASDAAQIAWDALRQVAAAHARQEDAELDDEHEDDD